MSETNTTKWIDAILNEDGHNLSSGSARTLQMIRQEASLTSKAIKEKNKIINYGNKKEKNSKKSKAFSQKW